MGREEIQGEREVKGDLRVCGLNTWGVDNEFQIERTVFEGIQGILREMFHGQGTRRTIQNPRKELPKSIHTRQIQ